MTNQLNSNEFRDKFEQNFLIMQAHFNQFMDSVDNYTEFEDLENRIDNRDRIKYLIEHSQEYPRLMNSYVPFVEVQRWFARMSGDLDGFCNEIGLAFPIMFIRTVKAVMHFMGYDPGGAEIDRDGESIKIDIDFALMPERLKKEGFSEVRRTLRSIQRGELKPVLHANSKVSLVKPADWNIADDLGKSLLFVEGEDPLLTIIRATTKYEKDVLKRYDVLTKLYNLNGNDFKSSGEMVKATGIAKSRVMQLETNILARMNIIRKKPRSDAGEA